ncbi:hypothetical protein LNKW23_19730 [Paralimibaculum aggregatum]|uniref:Protein ImuA n=1 Tax=Paralimibaculum aggregatum TaxID=3036245 RepID=A0ABQ6LKJ2_9RHOB|nr:hypothetical protein LNKW23_19730 [Limibaculum sp. NKW23]
MESHRTLTRPLRPAAAAVLDPALVSALAGGAARAARLALAGPAVPEGDVPALAAGLGRSGLHELVEARFGDMGAVAGFALAVLAGTAERAAAGPLVWIASAAAMRAHGRLSARGLAAAGGDPGRLLSVAVARPVDGLWAVEEALRSGAVAAVAAELPEAGFTATRRLSLAVAAAGVPALLLLPHDRAGASAAASRWRVAAAPSAPDPHDRLAPGAARWRVTVVRARAAPWAAGRSCELEVGDATHALRVVDRLADRPAAARAGPAGRGLPALAGGSEEALRRRA